MNRIDRTFARQKDEGKRGFVPFISAGDPDLDSTRELIIELARRGANVIELGVPFSDPVADGPVIQRSYQRALAQGVKLADALRVVAEARAQTDVAIVLFSYFNPLMQMGLERFAEQAEASGVDGVLVTDLVPEEAEGFNSILKQREINQIYLVAPTSTDERLKRVAAQARGFIYAVSRAGVTGARMELSTEAEKLVRRVRQISRLPIAVGFGVSTSAHVAEVWRYADAAVVGSAIVAEIERLSEAPDLVRRIGDFVGQLIAPPE